MADYDSSLPMRTETNGDAAVKIVDGATPANELTVESDGSVNARSKDGAGNSITSTSGKMDVALNDEAGNPFTAANPLPVSLEESSGDEKVEFDQADSIAKDASDNHDYTVTAAKTMLLSKIWCSASGKARFEVQFEDGPAAGTFTTKWVGFNSTSSPNLDIPAEKIGKQVAGAIVRIIRTNLDNQAQDLYSTIVGVEV